MNLLRPFKFILDNVDTTEEGTPFPPRLPYRSHFRLLLSKISTSEEGKFLGAARPWASTTKVCQNSLGGMDQNVNFYAISFRYLTNYL